MLWIKACLSLIILLSLGSIRAEEVQSNESNLLPTKGGMIELDDQPQRVLLLGGEWRYSTTPLQNITVEEFNLLPLKNAYTGNLQYLMLTEEATNGAYVLAIKVDRSFPLEMRLGGIVAAAQIKLIKPSGTDIVFQSEDYAFGQEAPGRDQIVNPSFNLNLEAGTSYLVYNFHQKPFKKLDGLTNNTGIVGPVRIGSKTAIDDNFSLSELFLKIPLGVFACLAIYSLLIFYSRRGEDKESLVLFIFNAATFGKEVFSQGIFVSFFPTSHVLLTLSSIGYCLPFLATATAIYFLNLKYSSRTLSILFTVAITNTVISGLNGFVLPNISFVPNSSLMGGMNVAVNAVVFFLIFIPYSIYSALKTKSREIVFFSIGIFFLGAGTLTDFFNTILNLGWPWLSMWGGMVLSIILAKNNSVMFARAFDSSKKLNIELEYKNREVESLNTNLEIKVIERTAEIKALLEHIPQGILSIADKGLVEGNYSAHLPDILEHKKIAGESFKGLFLDHCALSVDERDQAWQSILASIGESSLNFDMNSDKFPSETVYRLGEKQKVVKLTWNTELDAEDRVKRILVTLLDITQEHEAKRELQEKNKDLAIIKQLIEAGTKKASQFFGTAGQLLDENAQILATSELNMDTMKILFVNMHTVKGAARTLQFKELSAALHEAESQYAAVIKNGVVISQQELIEDISLAKATFMRYLQVNRDVLGRSEDFTKIQIDRDFLEQHYHLLHHLDQKMGLTADIKDVIHRNRDELTHLIFMSLDSVLNETLNQAEKIAKDLQKEPPRILINVGDVLINHRQEITLKNSFIHILRNALDHGIETAAERKTAGKSPQGSIHVAAWEDAASIILEVWDDGRGLALNRLREKAIETGLISAHAGQQEVANCIFSQGITTAASVSQISGRGVGMDAVRRFFEAEKGHIEILLGAPVDNAHQFYAFKFRITLPRGDINHAGGNDLRSSVA